eukprot:gene22495-42809_t
MINLGQHPAVYNEFKKIVIQEEDVEISEIALNRVKHSYEFLDNFCKGKIIYGINTGFGPMAPYRINAKHQKELQYNLVRSHSSGTGSILPPQYLRAMDKEWRRTAARLWVEQDRLFLRDERFKDQDHLGAG